MPRIRLDNVTLGTYSGVRSVLHSTAVQSGRAQVFFQTAFDMWKASGVHETKTKRTCLQANKQTSTLASHTTAFSSDSMRPSSSPSNNMSVFFIRDADVLAEMQGSTDTACMASPLFSMQQACCGSNRQCNHGGRILVSINEIVHIGDKVRPSLSLGSSDRVIHPAGHRKERKGGKRLPYTS